MTINSRVKLSFVIILNLFLHGCGEGIGGTGSPIAGGIGGTGIEIAAADGGIGGSGITTKSSFNFTGTVPGTLIEAFCDDGSYHVTKSEQNGTNKHPFTLPLPTGQFCRVVMTTNEADINNKVITPIRLVNSKGDGGIAFKATETISTGHVDLALTRTQMTLDANQDGVEDNPKDVVLKLANIVILSAGNDPLDKNNNGVIDVYEDDDGDGVNNKDDDDDDGDGILDKDDPDRINDLDGDGIPNDKDVDKTNDGILDKVEDEEGEGETGSGNTNNVVPVVQDDVASTGESRAVLIDVLGNDSDLDGDKLRIVKITRPANGKVKEVDGKLEYRPKAGFTGTDSFAYTIADGKGHEVTARVTVTVIDVNEAPVAKDDEFSTDENKAVIIDVLANDSDPDGDALIINSLTNPANGKVTKVRGRLQYTPKTDFFGTDTFIYTITDSNEHEAKATVRVIVNEVNEAPIAQDDKASTDENKAVDIDVLANDSDPDRDALAINTLTKPANGKVAEVIEGQLRYTPLNGFFGTDTFVYTVTDSKGHEAKATVTVIVNEVNEAPVALDDKALTKENQVVIIDVLSNDIDPDGDVLAIRSLTNPVNGKVVQLNGLINGQLQYTPNKGFSGTDTFIYTITDSKGHKSIAIVTVTVDDVNEAPVALDDESVTDENKAVVIDVLANDFDPDGDTLTIKSLTSPVSGKVVQIKEQQLQYTPKTDFFGTDSFAYTIIDSEGHKDKATVTVVVNENTSSNPADSELSLSKGQIAAIATRFDQTPDIDVRDGITTRFEGVVIDKDSDGLLSVGDVLKLHDTGGLAGIDLIREYTVTTEDLAVIEKLLQSLDAVLGGGVSVGGESLLGKELILDNRIVDIKGLKYSVGFLKAQIQDYVDSSYLPADIVDTGLGVYQWGASSSIAAGVAFENYITDTFPQGEAEKVIVVPTFRIKNSNVF